MCFKQDLLQNVSRLIKVGLLGLYVDCTSVFHGFPVYFPQLFLLFVTFSSSTLSEISSLGRMLQILISATGKGLSILQSFLSSLEPGEAKYWNVEMKEVMVKDGE